MLCNRFKKFDNSWLLDAALSQFPQDNVLHEAIKNCNRIMNGCYFVDPKKPNEPGSEWQFEKSVTLEDTPHGDIVLDILKDGRVGSIEYLDEVLGRK